VKSELHTQSAASCGCVAGLGICSHSSKESVSEESLSIQQNLLFANISSFFCTLGKKGNSELILCIDNPPVVNAMWVNLG